MKEVPTDPKDLVRDNGFTSEAELTDEELLLDAARELEKHHREQARKWRGGHPTMRGNCR